MENVQFDIVVIGNIIEIKPKDGMKDNSTYEIRLKNLKELDGDKVLDAATIKFASKLTPAYTDISAVTSVVEGLNLPEDWILYHIREASRYTDYIKGVIKIDVSNIPFEVTQFVKYKAAYDCVLRYYVDRAASGGSKGQLGDVLYDSSNKLPDISDLLKALKGYYEEWYDAVRGYKLEGRAKPVSTLRGKSAVNPPIMTNLGLDYDRGVS